jgi:EEF1A lysine methyltransferase 4
MDVCDMPEDLADNQFDMVIDKSTIDAILCGEDSFLNVARMVKETQRVLKPGGFYFVISYGKPESRSFHFEQEFLSFSVREFVAYEPAQEGDEDQDEKTHYIYLCEKRADADEICEKNWPKCLERLLIDAEVQRQLNEEYSDESDAEGSGENE